jgi:hypothetical protein
MTLSWTGPLPTFARYWEYLNRGVLKASSARVSRYRGGFGGAVRLEQLVGAEVTRVAFSYQVELLFLSGARVVIESEFSTQASDGRKSVLHPGNMTTDTDVVVSLLRAFVVECTISVDPSPTYEAFDIHFPGTPSRVLSIPGGSLEWWD